MSHVHFTLNGKPLTATAGQTILEAAQDHGIEIPRLCYKPGYRAAGNCRACVVEVQGERVLAPACCRAVSEGMTVHSNSPRALHSQKLVLELLASDMPERRYTLTDELTHWRTALGVGKPRFAARTQPASDMSHTAIHVNLDACIQCTRCVRACREEQGNDVIGLAFRGAHSQVVFDMNAAMSQSTCVACGECVQACPTGALSNSNGSLLEKTDREVASVCPYCGVGCQITYHVKGGQIIRVEGREGIANASRLCVKGRYGFDYVHHPARLTRPLIRRSDVPKDAQRVSLNHWSEAFREATWDEALGFAAQSLLRIKQNRGPRALAGFGSAKGTNEEAYLFQKLVRTGFGSNNVDHCTRLCHASSVAALIEGLGSAAVSNPVKDVLLSDVVLLIGANPAVNHPVAATWMKNAMQRGTRFIIADPRLSDLSRHAWRNLQFKPDTDVLLLNALLHTIITEGLADKAFIARRTRDYESIVRTVQGYAPEQVAARVGIDASTLREVARAFATASNAMILWGMGISQHVHGTDNARCLIALAMITGQIGRPGAGLHPLRGQNNVQGASDAGLIPMVFPDYQRVDNAPAHAKFETLWNTKLDSQPGLTVVEVTHAAARGEVRGMYIMGENPAMSDPDVQHVRDALAGLEMLVVQDIFLTETAALADVVLPASAWPEKTGTVTNTDRCVQLGRKALPLPGDARLDLWIIQQLAQRMGLPWQYAGEDAGVAAVYEEMRSAMPSIAGISWQRLEREGAVTYPCADEAACGERVVFTERFSTADGLARLAPAQFIPADELPDREFPFVLITGRQLEHWHTGAMTRRASHLHALEPAATASLHPSVLAGLGLHAGDTVTVSSRRGSITLAVRADEAVQADCVFIPFAYAEAAANLLTNDALDPFGKIAEVKYCAVKIEAKHAAHSALLEQQLQP